jgi:hypothetical protein
MKNTTNSAQAFTGFHRLSQAFTGFHRLKFLFAVLLIFGIKQGNLMAQSKTVPSLFTVVDLPKNLTEEQELMITKIEKYPNLKKVTYVDIADVDKVQDRGYLRFSIPEEGVKTQVIVRLKRLEVTNSEKSTAYGLKFSNGELSELMLNKEKGLVFGTLRHADKAYIIYGIDKHLSAILELDLSKMTHMVECSSHGDTDEKRTINTSPPPLTPEIITTCQNGLVTNVLILFTTAANNADPNIFQTAINCIANHNNILNNSNVTAQGAQLVSVGVESLSSFVDNSADIDGDVANLSVEPIANNRRNATNADIVVLLTNVGGYNGGNVAGAVRQVDAENINAYAIVEAPFAVTPNFHTFSHEVGHLFGGRHESTNDPGGPAYSRGRIYNGRLFSLRPRYRTMMHTFVSDRTRVPYFSNPNVSAGGGITGDASCCDVARRIGETAPRISGYRNVSTVFSTGILGIEYIYSSGSYDYEPAITCGCAPYSTNWVVSYNNGFSYTETTVNDQPITLNVYQGSVPQQGFITIQMTVTSCDGAVTTSFKNIQVELDGPTIRDPKGLDRVVNFVVSNNINSFSDIFPNPTSSTASFEYNLLESTHLKVVLLDALGKVVKTVMDDDKEKGYYQHKIDVAELNSGLYFLQIISNKLKERYSLLVSQW